MMITDTHLTAIYQYYPAKPVLKRLHSGFYWS